MIADLPIWQNLPAVSWVVIGICAFLLMFLLRCHVHRLITLSARLIHRVLRLCAKMLLRAQNRVRYRNHEVSKALIEELTERRLQRQFMRIEALVEQDLSHYQVLAAQINRRLNTIDEDYTASALVPPASPEWIAAVDAIARLEGDERNSEVISRILEEIHTTVQAHQRDVLREYRWTVNARHKILTRLQPHWRKLERALEKVAGRIERLRGKLDRVDHQMAYFEVLTSGIGDGLLFSIFSRFLIALLFSTIAAATLVVNYQLLSVPLAAVLGEQTALLPWISLDQLLSAVYCALIVSAGALLCEGMRVTRFFPLVGVVTRQGRWIMLSLGGLLLGALVFIEAFLLASTIATEESTAALYALFGLGVALPVFVALTAVPAEYLALTIRPVVASVLQVILQVMATLCRLSGALCIESARILNELYDLVIFIPLHLEREWQSRRQPQLSQEDQAAAKLDSGAALSSQNVTAVDFTSSIQRNTDR